MWKTRANNKRLNSFRTGFIPEKDSAATRCSKRSEGAMFLVPCTHEGNFTKILHKARTTPDLGTIKNQGKI